MVLDLSILDIIENELTVKEKIERALNSYNELNRIENMLASSAAEQSGSSVIKSHKVVKIQEGGGPAPARSSKAGGAPPVPEIDVLFY